VKKAVRMRRALMMWLLVGAPVVGFVLCIFRQTLNRFKRGKRVTEQWAGSTIAPGGNQP
jgi:hypothetical protein